MGTEQGWVTPPPVTPQCCAPRPALAAGSSPDSRGPGPPDPAAVPGGSVHGHKAPDCFPSAAAGSVPARSEAAESGGAFFPRGLSTPVPGLSAVLARLSMLRLLFGVGALQRSISPSCPGGAGDELPLAELERPPPGSRRQSKHLRLIALNR